MDIMARQQSRYSGKETEGVIGSMVVDESCLPFVWRRGGVFRG